MSKVVTLRLSEEEYKQISLAAKNQHRPISNFITSSVMTKIEESYFTDAIETDQILANKEFVSQLNAAHKEAKKMKGRMIG